MLQRPYTLWSPPLGRTTGQSLLRHPAVSSQLRAYGLSAWGNEAFLRIRGRASEFHLDWLCCELDPVVAPTQGAATTATATPTASAPAPATTATADTVAAVATSVLLHRRASNCRVGFWLALSTALDRAAIPAVWLAVTTCRDCDCWKHRRRTKVHYTVKVH